MAIKVNGTVVIDNSRNLSNVANLTVTGTVTGIPQKPTFAIIFGV